jgi:hypothetical protein
MMAEMIAHYNDTEVEIDLSPASSAVKHTGLMGWVTPREFIQAGSLNIRCGPSPQRFFKQ